MDLTDSSTPQPIWPSDISAPLTAVSPTDQSGIIAIITGFSLGLILLSTGVRLYAKRCAGVLRSDDFSFYAAVAFALAQTGVVCFLVSQGLGKVTGLLSTSDLVVIRRGDLASNILYIFVLAFSKTSCAMMFLAITPYKKHKLIAWILIGTTLIWLITSLFLEGFQCHTYPLRCNDFYARWLYISTLDILLETALIAHSISIVSPRQITLTAKLTVIFAFSCRIPNIISTILRLFYLRNPLTPASSSSYSARLQVVTQLNLAYTVTSCVIPYLRPLMQAHENADGSLRRASKEPSFKMSQGSKDSGRRRKNSGGKGKKYFNSSRAHSIPDSGPKSNPHHHLRETGSATYEDIGRLLGPQKAVLQRCRSQEPPDMGGGDVKAINWDYEHEIGTVAPLLPVLRRNPAGLSGLSEPWRGRRPVVRSARSGEDGGSFTAADFV